MTLRRRALTLLCLSDPLEKCTGVRRLRADALQSGWDTQTVLCPPKDTPLPGRPVSPRLVPALSVPQRSPFTPDGLAALVHSIAHIEFNAINLALDAVWRFSNMPEDFYSDWLRVADEEASHFGLLQEELRTMGHTYGDFDAHDGLWGMCVKTQDNITARMALVPRTLEARGLDATPLIQSKLHKVGTPTALRTVAVLDIILREEIGHVAIGNRWYGWLCRQQGLDPVTHYRALARTHAAPRPKPPLNNAARLAAGFSQVELDFLLSP